MRPVALVTGASKGIGAAVAVRLAEEGFDLWLNYRSDSGAALAVAAKIRELGGEATLLPFDVVDADATEAALAPLLAADTPFALVNNAGFARDGLLALKSLADWKSVLDVHLTGFFNVTKPVVQAMIRKRKGRIVNIVSTSGRLGVGGQTDYSAAKAGLIGATRSLAMELAPRSITVNAVEPGFIDTDMTKDLPKEQIVPRIPLRRFGRVEEVAHAVAFLVSDKAAYITGHTLSVNGGVFMG